jgi:hypothetical protein
MPIVQQRRGTAASLQTVTLAAGQIAYETDTGKIKVGDGTTVYSGLEYVTDASNIADSSISTSKIADGAINNSKLADSAVSMEKMQNNSVITGAIQDSAVTEAKLATNSVTAAKIADNAITATKIPDGNVTSQKIASNAVTADKIHDGVVTTAKIADDAVTSAKIAANAVTNSEIAANTILTGNIAAGAINTQSITNDAVTYAKIQNVGAGKVLGNDTTSSGNVTELDSTIFGRSLLNVADGATLASTLGVATTSQITAAIDNLIDSAPGALNTLNELAAAIADDVAFSTTVTDSIATKLPLAGGTVTGDIDMSRSASSKTKFDWGNSNGSGNFSNAATDLDYIRLYTSGSTVAGMGITASNFNIGTNGAINVSIYAAGVLNEKKTGTLTRHYVDQFNNGKIYTAGGSATLPVISREGDSDTGIYYPSLGAFAITVDGDEKIKVTNDKITLSRKASQPTIEADATGVDGVAGGWMIIDSVTNPCSLNYYSGADVQLAYGGGGATVGTCALGSYKFRVHGGTSHFSNALTVAADAVYSPVFRSKTDGSLSATAYGRENDGNTGMYFPAANKIALAAGGGDMLTAESGNVEVSQHFRIPDGTASLPGIAFGTDTNTGIYQPADDQLAISTGGTVAARISSAGSIAVGTHAPHDAYLLYITRQKSEQTSFQGIASNPQHSYSQAGTFQTIGVNGSSTLTPTTTNIDNSGYIRGLHGAATFYSKDGCNAAEVTGVHGIGQHHVNSTGDGTVNAGYGVKGYYYESNPGGTTASAFGVRGNINLTSNADATSSIGHAYCMYASVNSSYTNRITNGFGLYIDVVEAATAWGVYQAQAGMKNRFYGTVEHGNTTGSAGSYIPGIAFISDPNTGFGKGSTADVIDVICGGYDIVKFSTVGMNFERNASITSKISFDSYGTSLDSANLDFGYIQLYNGSFGADVCGFGVTTNTMNIGAKGGIDVKIYARGNQKVYYQTSSTTHSGQQLVDDGTALNPAIAFASDTDTGIKLNSNGNMDLVHGGANKISVTSAGSSLGGTVTMNHQISDGTTTATTASLMAKIDEPSGYGSNLLFG